MLPLDDNFPHSKKGTKMHKLHLGEGFGKDFCCLLLGRTILKRKSTICHKFTNVMSIKVEILYLGVIYQIISKLDCTLIVTFEHSRQFWS